MKQESLGGSKGPQEKEFPGLALVPSVREKVMNAVLSEWATRHSHLHTGREVATCL